MNYQLKHFADKDGFDAWMTVAEEPDWYNFCERRYRRFWGSGSTWWEIVKDQWDSDKEERCSSLMSSILHKMWNDQLNKRLEEKTCKR